MMNAVLYLLIVGCCVYTAGVLIVILALDRIGSGNSADLPFVTVVIAARNERTTLGLCLYSLMVQDYPADRYEVVVADDRSGDGTAEVLARFREVWETLGILRIDSVPDGVSPKKHALMKAIEAARSDVILQTDADCIAPETWISGMVRGFDKDVALVAGLSPYLPARGLLNSFVRHEYLWNAALLAGSMSLGMPTHATGRNLGFRRDVFTGLGGYGSSERILSGDDTLLVHRIRHTASHRMVCMPDASTHVLTPAPSGPAAFVRQRVRHMSTGRRFDPLLIAVGGAVYGFHALLPAAFFLSFISLKSLNVFATVVFWKLLVDAFAAWKTSDILSLDVQWDRFLINEVLLVLYMAVMPMLGLLVPVKWKDTKETAGRSGAAIQ